MNYAKNTMHAVYMFVFKVPHFFYWYKGYWIPIKNFLGNCQATFSVRIVVIVDQFLALDAKWLEGKFLLH